MDRQRRNKTSTTRGEDDVDTRVKDDVNTRVKDKVTTRVKDDVNTRVRDDFNTRVRDDVTTRVKDDVKRAAEQLSSLSLRANKKRPNHEAEKVSVNGSEETLKRKFNDNQAQYMSASSSSGYAPGSSSQTEGDEAISGPVIPLPIQSIDSLSESQVVKKPRKRKERTTPLKSSRASTHRLRKFRRFVKLGNVEEVTNMLDTICTEEGVSTCRKFANTKVEGEVALFVAIENNDLLILQQLLRFGATPTVYLENIDKYPIFTAAERPGCFDVLQQLIAHSHNDLHFCDQNGFRTLERALLVHRSRPASGFTNNARTVSFLIDQMEPEKLLKVCLNRKTTLHVAAESHDFMLFSRLLNSPNIGDFINYQDINGNTVSHVICAARDMEESDQLLMLNYLRTSGAVAVPNNNRDLPYQLARSHNVASAARVLRCTVSALSTLIPSPPRPPPLNHSLTSCMASAKSTGYIQNVTQTPSSSNMSQMGTEVTRESDCYVQQDHIPSLYGEASNYNLSLKQACFGASVSEIEHKMPCGNLSDGNLETTRTSHRPLPPPLMDIEREVSRVSPEMPVSRTAIHEVSSGFPAVRNDIRYVSQGFLTEKADIGQVGGYMSGSMNLPVSQPLSVNVSNEFEAYVLQNQLGEQNSPYSVSSSSASDNDAQFEVAFGVIKSSQ